MAPKQKEKSEAPENNSWQLKMTQEQFFKTIQVPETNVRHYAHQAKLHSKAFKQKEAGLKMNFFPF